MPRRGSSSRQKKRPSSEDETKSQHNAEGSLTEISRDAVGKLLRRANRGSKKKTTVDFEPEQNVTRVLEPIVPPKTSEVEHCNRNSIGKDSAEEKCGHISLDEGYADRKEELDDSDWEDGTVAMDDLPMTIELNVTPDSSVKKQIRRASAEDKELAELVHKAHLLCLLARGRLIDRACDDVLIQASLLSLLPVDLFPQSKVTKLTSKDLHPLISWFHDNFHVKNYTNGEKSPHFALASALELHEGSSEEIAALSVALFRALNLTARYCMKWHKIASQRVNSTWWDSVLAPLRNLESGATGGVAHLRTNQSTATEANMNDSFVPTRSSLEDIELETRALTEPLPTNQQAYKSHPLYAIEKWLTKYQLLHPKGPILGFCSGHPVYPRTCVQTVMTKERWLREGLQVKPNENPAKELKRPIKPQKVQDFEADDRDCTTDSKENIKLYGKWQLEPLNLPHAVNGIVPKNDRGQVDVWSEKCLPPGTVHLRFPRAYTVAKRLEIDYAPAMVGFEFKNGRSYPVYDGIVVCAEFKDTLLEAFAEEDERRKAEEKKRDEAQALRRWYQLLSSIVTRQRLNNRYNNNSKSEVANAAQDMKDNMSNATVCGSNDQNQTPENHQMDNRDTNLDESVSTSVKDHEHVFLKENESFDEETFLLTKRCQCGFSVQVEEL
ncbi:hypothetical protein RYX36_006500 [Vicia faba]